MAKNSEFGLVNELQSCFNDLKKHSVSFKLGQAQPTVGDEMQNPLHQQFELILTKIEETLGKMFGRTKGIWSLFYIFYA